MATKKLKKYCLFAIKFIFETKFNDKDHASRTLHTSKIEGTARVQRTKDQLTRNVIARIKRKMYFQSQNKKKYNCYDAYNALYPKYLMGFVVFLDSILTISQRLLLLTKKVG